MSFVLRFVCAVLPVLAASLPLLPPRAEPVAMSQVTILTRDAGAAYAQFELEGLPEELTSPLVFDFEVNQQVDTVDGPAWTRLVLNQVNLDLPWETQDTSTLVGAVSLNSTNGALTPAPSQLAVHKASTHSLPIEDHFGFIRQIELSISGAITLSDGLNGENEAQSILTFAVHSIDGFAVVDGIGFSIVARFNPYLNIDSPYRPTLVDVVPLASPFTDYDSPMLPSYSPFDDDHSEDEATELDFEIQQLMLLEQQAGSLQAEIAQRKQRIASRLRRHRDQASLRHLLEQCDGLVCAAKVIAQRICDKVGITLEPSFKYSNLQHAGAQDVMALGGKAGSSWNASEKDTNQTGPTPLPTYVPHNATTLPMVEFVTPTTSLIQILEFVAAALGLVTLFSFLRRKCMSPRSRADRAADREERQNARAYRRAARRAYISSRWNAFVKALNCFKPQDAALGKRIEDYEEKRALILQDAFLEQDVELAEKGEVMEAEIRELRNAHDIVRSLVRNGEEVPPMYHDPPPPMVPLPESFTPITGRSRASTNTLPSYTSESLPDYTSRPDLERNPLLISPTLDGSSSSGLGSASSDTGGDHSDSLFSPIDVSEDGDSGSERRWRRHDGSRSTPTSSVIETSPRPSDETLRTTGRRSGEC